jgi:hypothetical protein
MMISPEGGGTSEFYIVEKSIEVAANINGEDRQIRIDALQGPAAPAH